MKHYVYILRCVDGTLYTGYATNLEKRLKEHNGEGDTVSERRLGARYTRGRRPVALVYHEGFATRSEAMKREWEIKQMTRREKTALFE